MFDEVNAHYLRRKPVADPADDGTGNHPDANDLTPQASCAMDAVRSSLNGVLERLRGAYVPPGGYEAKLGNVESEAHAKAAAAAAAATAAAADAKARMGGQSVCDETVETQTQEWKVRG